MWRLNKVTTPRKRLAGQAWNADPNYSESNPLHAGSSGGSNIYSCDLVLARKGDSTSFRNDTRHRRDTTPCIDDKADRSKAGPAGLHEEFKFRLNDPCAGRDVLCCKRFARVISRYHGSAKPLVTNSSSSASQFSEKAPHILVANGQDLFALIGLSVSEPLPAEVMTGA